MSQNSQTLNAQLCQENEREKSKGRADRKDDEMVKGVKDKRENTLIQQ
jgi:hypothetical protein